MEGKRGDSGHWRQNKISGHHYVVMDILLSFRAEKYGHARHDLRNTLGEAIHMWKCYILSDDVENPVENSAVMVRLLEVSRIDRFNVNVLEVKGDGGVPLRTNSKPNKHRVGEAVHACYLKT